MSEETNKIFKTATKKSLYYAALLVAFSFLAPLYVLISNNIELNISKYMEILSNFVWFGASCLAASVLVAIIFEVIDVKIKSKKYIIGSKLLFVIALFAISFTLSAIYS